MSSCHNSSPTMIAGLRNPYSSTGTTIGEVTTYIFSRYLDRHLKALHPSSLHRLVIVPPCNMGCYLHSATPLLDRNLKATSDVYLLVSLGQLTSNGLSRPFINKSLSSISFRNSLSENQFGSRN